MKKIFFLLLFAVVLHLKSVAQFPAPNHYILKKDVIYKKEGAWEGEWIFTCPKVKN